MGKPSPLSIASIGLTFILIGVLAYLLHLENPNGSRIAPQQVGGYTTEATSIFPFSVFVGSAIFAIIWFGVLSLSSATILVSEKPNIQSNAKVIKTVSKSCLITCLLLLTMTIFFL